VPVGRWFIDENLLKVGRALAQVRVDVVYPGHPKLPQIPRRTLDDQWLPIVGQAGWVVITRDRRIRSRPVQRERFEAHNVRAFCITGKTEMTDWAKLSLLVRQWPAMESQVEALAKGPWMCSVTGAGVRQMPNLS
jgi:PIN like domain